MEADPILNADGTQVYVAGAQDATIYALYVTTGAVKWKYTPPTQSSSGFKGKISEAPVLGTGAMAGKMFFGSWDGYIYAIKYTA